MLTLRDHPLFARHGRRIWPPRWTTTRKDKTDTPKGEEGVLQESLMSRLLDNQLFLVIDYNEKRYMGGMMFDDPAFCSKICTLLKLKTGLSIKEIGDLDLSHLR